MSGPETAIRSWIDERGALAAEVAVADGHSHVGSFTIRESVNGAALIRNLRTEAIRDSGVASPLLQKAGEWAASNGFQLLVCEARGSSSQLAMALEACGFRADGSKESAGTVVSIYTRRLNVREKGTRLPLQAPPSVAEEALLAIVERPRGYIEGWRHHPGRQELVLDEYYDRPVPVNYGFAPLWINPADGDALDVIVLDDARVEPGQALACEPAGVVWRPDGDHKLLAIPTSGVRRPVALDDALRERVDGWWDETSRPTGWAGKEAIPTLLAQCRPHTYKG